MDPRESVSVRVRVIASRAMCAVLVGHSGVKRGCSETTRGSRAPVVYSAYNPFRMLYLGATRPQSVCGLREKASSRSSGVSADIRSTHSAEK